MSLFWSKKPTKNATDKYLWHIILFVLYPILYIFLVSILLKKGVLPTYIDSFDLFILVFASFRLTRLFVYDDITNFLRDFLATSNTWLWKSLSELINCPWCTSVWVALILTFFYYISPLTWMLLLILAIAWLVWFLQVAYKTFARFWDSLKKGN